MKLHVVLGRHHSGTLLCASFSFLELLIPSFPLNLHGTYLRSPISASISFLITSLSSRSDLVLCDTYLHVCSSSGCLSSMQSLIAAIFLCTNPHCPLQPFSCDSSSGQSLAVCLPVDPFMSTQLYSHFSSFHSSLFLPYLWPSLPWKPPLQFFNEAKLVPQAIWLYCSEATMVGDYKANKGHDLLTSQHCLIISDVACQGWAPISSIYNFWSVTPTTWSDSHSACRNLEVTLVSLWRSSSNAWVIQVQSNQLEQVVCQEQKIFFSQLGTQKWVNRFV